MLLDKYVLTKAFENLLSFHAPAPTPSTPGTPTPSHQPPTSFVKRVNHSMTRIDPLLKTLQVRPVPPEGLVQAYLGYIGDRSDTNFRKILELKGVRKQDQAHLIELFAIHRDGTGAGRQLVQNSTLLTPLMSTTGLGSTGLAPVAAAGSLQSRFDAASLGERLLNVARDGVERINVGTAGSGTAGVSGLGITSPGGSSIGGGSSAGVPPGGQNATINENLKNIGKFFRRDIGGLGARFGKRDVTPTGHGDDDKR